MTDVEAATLTKLADKLESLNLDANEKALLDRLMDRAASYTPEVQGFQFRYKGDSAGADLSPRAFKLGRSIGIIPPTIGLGIGGPDIKPPPP